jgi:two-component system, cell cycle sensor histidine kinase and response regulator CckA
MHDLSGRAVSTSGEAEQQYRSLVEQLPLVTYTDRLDDTSSNIYSSPQIEAMLGYTVEEWEADPELFVKILHPDDIEWVLAAQRPKVESSRALEYRVFARDGRVVWLRDEATQIRGEHGEPLHLQGYLLDITQQKEAESRLGAAEEKYRRLAEELPIVTYVDPVEQHGSSLYMSPQIEKLTGYPREQWEHGREFFRTALHPDDRERVLAAHRQATGTFSLEYRLIARDGQVVWIRDESMVICDEEGKTLYIQGFMRDITEQRKAEAELVAAERKYRALAEQLPLVSFIASLEEEKPLLYVSPQIEQLFGYGIDSWLSDPGLVARVIHPADRDRVLRDARARNGAFAGEFRAISRDGRVLWIEDATVVVPDEHGAPAYRQGYLRDITERKETEQRRELHLSVATILAESTSSGAALDRILAELCRTLEWNWGSYWALDQADQALRCVAWWHPESVEATEFEQSAESVRLAQGEGLPGRVWETREPVWLEDFPAAGFPRSDAAARDGLRTLFGVPVMAGKEVLGVIELSSRDPKRADAALSDTLAVVGSEIGQFLERTRAQEDLRTSETLLAEAQRIAHTGSWNFELSTGQLVWSDELLAVFGIDRTEFRGEYADFIDGVHPEDRKRIDELSKLAWESHDTPSHEYRIVRPDGEVRYVRGEWNTKFDDSGVATHLTGTVQDVTDQHSAEMKLRESEERFRAVFDSAAVGIHVLGEDGRIVTANRAFASMLGYEVGELVGMEISLITHPEDEPASRVLRAKVLRQGGDFSRLEKRYLAKDGAVVWASLIAVPIKEADGSRYSIGLVEDLRKRLQLEEELRQAQKMEAVGQLAGGIAHDFNNLLLAIRGYSELALTHFEAKPDVARRDIEQVKAATERAASLISQLLAFSRKQILQPRVVDLNVLVTASSDLLRHVIGEHIELELRLDSQVGTVRLDPVQMEQGLLNLVINASDAMPEGGRLTIGTENVVSVEGMPLMPGTYVKVFVSDTGVGMDAATRERAFEPFFTTKEGTGTGLGLSMLYGFAEQSNGQVLVDSAPGEGSTFEVYFPTAEEQAAEMPKAPPPIDGQGSETVLLVEDEEAVRELLRRALVLQGYSVLEAEDGRAALEVAAEFSDPIDVLVTDVVMPRMGGVEAAEALLARRPGLRVVYMSGHVRDRRAFDTARIKGVFLQKPFAPEALVGAIREVVSKTPGRETSSSVGA